MVQRIESENFTPYGHLEEGHEIAAAPFIFPGVRGKLKRSLTTGAGTVIPADTKVIIQPINRHQSNALQAFKITPYTDNKDKKNSHQPESHRDIEVGESCTFTIPNPEDYLSFSDEHYRRSDEALFPHADSPTFAEINQARVPDCFLLAAIQTMLNHPHGKAFIRGMMRQNTDGTTTVRLHNTQTGQPVYVRVENSVIVDGLGELNLHAALWVHILEKAYAALGHKDDVAVNASVSTVYSGGGRPKNALLALTGIRADGKSTTSPRHDPLEVEDFLGDLYPVASAMIDVATDAQVLNMVHVLQPEQLHAIYHLFDLKSQDATAQTAAFKKYVQLIKCYKSEPARFKAAVKAKSSQSLRDSHPVVASALTEIFQRAQAFSGHYSLYQNNVYQELRTALAQGKLITATTPTEYEQKPVGLVQRHAYSVLDVVEKPMRVRDKNGCIKNIMVKFVEVRNPWGDMTGITDTLRDLATGGIGRQYHQNRYDLDIQVVATNKATSLIELSDFCKDFSRFDITRDSANASFKRDAEKEQCLAAVNTFYTTHRISYTSSNLDLINVFDQHAALTKKLMAIELHELCQLDAAKINSINAIFAEHHTPDVEKNAIIGLLDEKQFPRIMGTPEIVKQHAYALLKYQWLATQDLTDHSDQLFLLDFIQQHGTQKEAWDKLQEVKLIVHTVFTTRYKAHQETPDMLEDMSQQLQTKMTNFVALFNQRTALDAALITASFDDMVNNLHVLERLFYEIFNLDLTAKKFGYTTNDYAALCRINTVIQHCKEALEPIIAITPEFKQLWDVCKDIQKTATRLEAKHVISSAENHVIQSRQLADGSYKTMGLKMAASENTERRALGHQLIEADTLYKKVQRALAAINNFFAKVANNVSTFFHMKNAYELPAHQVNRPARTR